MPIVSPVLALPSPLLITSYRKSGIVRKSIDSDHLYGATRGFKVTPLSKGDSGGFVFACKLSMATGNLELATVFLFRNNRGIHPDSSENKMAYTHNARGFKRHKSGTICGISKSAETAR